MRAARAAIEPRVRPAVGVRDRALQRVLQQADVPLRRAHEHGHLVERHAAARFLDDAAGDLDRFTAFAWSREEAHVAGLSRSGGCVPANR